MALLSLDLSVIVNTDKSNGIKVEGMTVLTSPSWQEVLQRIISTPLERKRLATALGINEMTLNRWTKTVSHPQRSHLVGLVQLIPPHFRTELIEALERSYPDAQNWLYEDPNGTIPSEFYAQVLADRAITFEVLRTWRLLDTLLKQALSQLDSNQFGMSLTLVQCMPPSQGGKIRSLRERMGRGTPPWLADLDHLALFLGVESLAGYVVQKQRPASIRDLREEELLPAYQAEFEISAAAHPIFLEGRIAGCLLASSTQVDYFTQQRIALLGAFSDIVSLILDKQDFYQPELIELKFMARSDIQRMYLSTFRQRVINTMLTASEHGHPILHTNAEEIVWRELEEILLTLD